MNSVFDFKVKNARGEDVELEQYRGKILLVVNVASACGYTPQYEGLQALFQKYSDQGLMVLGFPCNQFGAQESGTNEEIQSFCTGRFGVKFPVLAKIDVNGAGADPLYVHLKKEAPGILGTEAIKWNFTKFLVGRDGRVIKRYAPQDKPDQIERDIQAALGGTK
jgi:glutathione peroxidase